MYLFLKKHKTQLFSTFLVVGLFTYFWVNGPLQPLKSVILFEQPMETPFSESKIIEEKTNGNKKEFGTITDTDEKSFGTSLLLENDNKIHSSHLIVSKKDLQVNQKTKDRLQKHLLKMGVSDFNIKMTSNFAYAKTNNGLYFESKYLTNHIHGYAGPLNIAVFVNENGDLQKVLHISSKETKSYLDKIQKSGFYKQFQKKNIEEESKIDAVSGATITSKAVAETVASLVHIANPNPLEDFTSSNQISNFNIRASLNFLWILDSMVIGVLFIYGLQKKIKKRKKTRLILNLTSVIYIGFFLNNSFTYTTFLHPFLGTSISMFTGLYALFTLLGSIWGKNIYCNYVCPFGNLQKVMLSVNPKKMAKPFFLSNKTLHRIRESLTILLIIGIFTGMRNWSSYELFPDVFGIEFMSYWFFISVGMILINLKYPMIWCKMLCPTGAVLDRTCSLAHGKLKW